MHIQAAARGHRARFDANGDGKLDAEDIKYMVHQMKVSLDADGDGKLDCNDVLLLCCPSCAPKASRYQTTAAHVDVEPAPADCDEPDGVVSGEGGAVAVTSGFGGKRRTADAANPAATIARR